MKRAAEWGKFFTLFVGSVAVVVFTFNVLWVAVDIIYNLASWFVRQLRGEGRS